MDSQRQVRGLRSWVGTCLAAWGSLLGAAGCGDVLGPGASPEPAEEVQPAGPEAARRWQAGTASHFGLPTEIADRRGVRFRLVPPGTFVMGSPPDEEGRRPDESPYEVTLLVPYYLQAAEVSWGEIRAWRPELVPDEEAGRDTHPARGLTHDEVRAFIDWVNSQDPVWYHRLPSEAEWENACRAGSTGAWGAGIPSAAEVWAGGHGPGPRPVGGGEANGLGLHDMHGNVAEWCRGWYAAYPSSAAQMPTGPTMATERVVRGGAWRDPIASARCAARDRLAPGARDGRVGFRLLVETGYGVPGMGPHPLRVQTYAGLLGDPHREARPGVHVRLVSVPERLTARQEDRPIRWRELPGTTPLTITMLPGRYYLQAWKVVDGQVVRGRERKFMIPDDLPEVDVEVPGD